MQDADDGTLDDMPFLVMTDFVGQYRHDLRNGMPLNQGIKKNNAFIPAETGEESIRPRGAFRTIADKDVLEGEIH